MISGVCWFADDRWSVLGLAGNTGEIDMQLTSINYITGNPYKITSLYSICKVNLL